MINLANLLTILKGKLKKINKLYPGFMAHIWDIANLIRLDIGTIDMWYLFSRIFKLMYWPAIASIEKIRFYFQEDL